MLSSNLNTVDAVDELPELRFADADADAVALAAAPDASLYFSVQTADSVTLLMSQLTVVGTAPEPSTRTKAEGPWVTVKG